MLQSYVTNIRNPQTLSQIIRALEAELGRLRYQLQQEKALEASRRRLRDLRTIPHRLDALTRTGWSLDSAKAVVAEELQVSLETVEAYDRADAAARRRRELLRLYQAGMSNAEIARRLGMHEKSVSRAIRRALSYLPPRR